MGEPSGGRGLRRYLAEAGPDTAAGRGSRGDEAESTDAAVDPRPGDPAPFDPGPVDEAPADADALAARDARFERLMRAWWRDEHPDWTSLDWWDTPLRDEVRGLLWLPAGEALAGALSRLPNNPACAHPHEGEALADWPTPGHATGWPCACQVVMAAAWEACAAWVAAGAAAALVTAAGPTPTLLKPTPAAPQITDPAREELAVALRLSPGSMSNRIAAARDLMSHPRLHALVASAGISAWAGRLVVLELAGLPDALGRQVADEIVDRVQARLASGRRPWTSAEVARNTRMIRLRRAPENERATRARAFAQRAVRVHEDGDGMAVLEARLDATDAHRIHRRLTAIAEGMDDPTRSRDQVRADVLVDLLLGSIGAASVGPVATPLPPQSAALAETGAAGRCAGSAPHAPMTSSPNSAPHAARGCAPHPAPGSAPQPDPPAEAGGRARPEINVVVSLATLLGLTDDPAVVPGLGPIPADLARTLAADGTWRAWITDASGTVVATSSRTYQPGAGLARLVRAREPHCRMPGCRRPAERCDLDHTVPWPAGCTTASNLGPLCRRHHNLKTHAGWTLLAPQRGPYAAPTTNRPASGWTWRTPAGFTVHDDGPLPLE